MKSEMGRVLDLAVARAAVTKVELAAILGISPSFLSAVSRGHKRIAPDMATALAAWEDRIGVTPMRWHTIGARAAGWKIETADEGHRARVIVEADAMLRAVAQSQEHAGPGDVPP